MMERASSEGSGPCPYSNISVFLLFPGFDSVAFVSKMRAPMRDHVKLFIPGPVEVSPDTYAAMSAPMIGHRSKDFQDLYAEIQPKLQTLFGTKQQVYISTSSAWGVMEGSHPQPGEEEGAQLLLRRVLGQVV